MFKNSEKEIQNFQDLSSNNWNAQIGKTFAQSLKDFYKVIRGALVKLSDVKFTLVEKGSITLLTDKIDHFTSSIQLPDISKKKTRLVQLGFNPHYVKENTTGLEKNLATRSKNWIGKIAGLIAKLPIGSRKIIYSNLLFETAFKPIIGQLTTSDEDAFLNSSKELSSVLLECFGISEKRQAKKDIIISPNANYFAVMDFVSCSLFSQGIIIPKLLFDDFVKIVCAPLDELLSVYETKVTKPFNHPAYYHSVCKIQSMNVQEFYQIFQQVLDDTHDVLVAAKNVNLELEPLESKIDCYLGSCNYFQTCATLNNIAPAPKEEIQTTTVVPSSPEFTIQKPTNRKSKIILVEDSSDDNNQVITSDVEKPNPPIQPELPQPQTQDVIELSTGPINQEEPQAPIDAEISFTSSSENDLTKDPETLSQLQINIEKTKSIFNSVVEQVVNSPSIPPSPQKQDLQPEIDPIPVIENKDQEEPTCLPELITPTPPPPKENVEIISTPKPCTPAPHQPISKINKIKVPSAAQVSKMLEKKKAMMSLPAPKFISLSSQTVSRLQPKKKPTEQDTTPKELPLRPLIRQKKIKPNPVVINLCEGEEEEEAEQQPQQQTKESDEGSESPECDSREGDLIKQKLKESPSEEEDKDNSTTSSLVIPNIIRGIGNYLFGTSQQKESITTTTSKTSSSGFSIANVLEKKWSSDSQRQQQKDTEIEKRKHTQSEIETPEPKIRKKNVRHIFSISASEDTLAPVEHKIVVDLPSKLEDVDLSRFTLTYQCPKKGTRVVVDPVDFCEDCQDSHPLNLKLCFTETK